MHFLVTSTKHRIYSFLFYTTCGESLLKTRAVELHQFCRGASALLTVLQLNPRTICSTYQLMSLKISHFSRYLNLIVITRIFLLNIEDADILFVKSSISFSVFVCIRVCVCVCVNMYMYTCHVMHSIFGYI